MLPMNIVTDGTALRKLCPGGKTKFCPFSRGYRTTSSFVQGSSLKCSVVQSSVGGGGGGESNGTAQIIQSSTTATCIYNSCLQDGRHSRII